MEFTTSSNILDLICILMLVQVLSICLSSKISFSIIGISIFGLLCSIAYTLMDALDVAMTEASLGACITSAIMLKVASNLSPKNEVKKSDRLLALFLSIAFASLLIYAGMDLPKYGDIHSPVHSYIMDYYHENTHSEIGITSFVAAILGSYRGFDTLGETLVIYIAGICVIYIAGFLEVEEERMFEDDIIISSISKIIFPIIALFVIYIQLNGTNSPGGGFQAGAILASIYIGMNIGLDYRIKQDSLVTISSLGIFLYLLPGIIAILLGYNFLDYDALSLGPISQKIGIEIVELGIGITVAATVIILYQTFFTTSVTKVTSSSKDP